MDLLPPSTLCSRGCGRAYHATYGNEPLCLPCRRADVRPASTDRSRSPRVSDEARFLQRLAEPELPPGATDAPPTESEISNQRAAELTEADAEVAAARAERLVRK